ncbi:MAG: hypothetical protein A3F14_00280 [Gammaproteobacteria bacterium RIFCSPHIGHO2_12_FULL_43_28]|nr:MAG: hypothetical protein A3F14_00280 [Gammaproteobacteria bacterium RIFCSPHIGHO2_12_FULL_43_28]
MNNKNSNLLRYQKYLDNWDSVSSVRSKPNKYQMTSEHLDAELNERRWFIKEGVPILEHPLLKGMDRECEQYLLGRFLLQFLEYGTILEHEFVNTILADMALGESGVPIPDRMRVDAFKIYTDEAYHAQFNMEATQQIRDYIGMPVSEAWPLQNSRLIGLRKLIPQNKSRENFLVRFGIVVASETIAPKELTETMKGIVIEPIYNLFVDHAEDEKKHCMYFSALFEVVWNYLSDDEKQYLGLIFPKILKSFVDINKVALFDALAKIGVDKQSAKMIIDDSYPEDFCVKRALSVASSTFFNLERLGVYSISGVRDAFKAEGFARA